MPSEPASQRASERARPSVRGDEMHRASQRRWACQRTLVRAGCSGRIVRSPRRRASGGSLQTACCRRQAAQAGQGRAGHGQVARSVVGVCLQPAGARARTQRCWGLRRGIARCHHVARPRRCARVGQRGGEGMGVGAVVCTRSRSCSSTSCCCCCPRPRGTRTAAPASAPARTLSFAPARSQPPQAGRQAGSRRRNAGRQACRRALSAPRAVRALRACVRVSVRAFRIGLSGGGAE